MFPHRAHLTNYPRKHCKLLGNLLGRSMPQPPLMPSVHRAIKNTTTPPTTSKQLSAELTRLLTSSNHSRCRDCRWNLILAVLPQRFANPPSPRRDRTRSDWNRSARRSTPSSSSGDSCIDIAISSAQPPYPVSKPCYRPLLALPTCHARQSSLNPPIWKREMSNMTTVEAKAFVPSKDFALSKQFYQEFGLN
jgi:hypothetical protein